MLGFVGCCFFLGGSDRIVVDPMASRSWWVTGLCLSPSVFLVVLLHIEADARAPLRVVILPYVP